jgi:cytochrome c5
MSKSAPKKKDRGYINVLLIAVAIAMGAKAQAAELSARESYTLGQICAYCHARSETTSPVMGDREEWQRRAVNGFEGLVTNTIVGVGNMPPLGTCGYCTEAEIRNIVAAMTGIAPSALPQRDAP